jgi:hypothetical protein
MYAHQRIGVAMTSAWIASVWSLCTAVAWAQAPAPAAPSGPPPSARQAAVIDLTGYWVSIVNEDWRWRMMTPPKGDYASVPLNPAGKAMADTWDVSQDGSCKAYYVAGLMRMPTRLHISWAGDDVLQIESDWGQQSRRVFFKSADLPAPEAGTPQGRSLGTWQHPVRVTGAPGRGGAPLPGGSLLVTTDHLAPGWLRRNGVPYSEHAQLTEYFDRFQTPDGKEWFVVTTIVDDPTYLTRPFITSSHFRREADGAKWTPRPCKS